MGCRSSAADQAITLTTALCTLAPLEKARGMARLARSRQFFSHLGLSFGLAQRRRANRHLALEKAPYLLNGTQDWRLTSPIL
jgi:hypothetical protein